MNKFFLKITLAIYFIAQPAHAMGPMGPAIRSRAVIEADMDAVADQALAAAREIRERKRAINMPFLLANELPVCMGNLGNQSPDSYVDIISEYANDLPFNPTQERKKLLAQEHAGAQEERKEHDIEEERKDEEDQKHEGDPDPLMHNAPVGHRLEPQRALADAEQRLAQHEERMEALVAERNHVEEHARRLEEAIRQELERLAQIERDRLEEIQARGAARERYYARGDSIIWHFFTNPLAMYLMGIFPAIITQLLCKNFNNYVKLPDASLTKSQLLKKRLFYSSLDAAFAQVFFSIYNCNQLILLEPDTYKNIHNQYVINGFKAHSYYVLFDLLHHYGSDLFTNKTDRKENEKLQETTVPSPIALKQKLSWGDSFKYYSLRAIKTAIAGYLARKQI